MRQIRESRKLRASQDSSDFDGAKVIVRDIVRFDIPTLIQAAKD